MNGCQFREAKEEQKWQEFPTSRSAKTAGFDHHQSASFYFGWEFFGINNWKRMGQKTERLVTFIGPNSRVYFDGFWVKIGFEKDIT